MTSLKLRLGTRASALARWQAEWVAARLAEQDVAVELVPITTRGDAQQRDPIGNLGSPGVFTKEIQRALLDHEVDLAVHSLKDLPTDVVDGLVLAAVPERESPFDALISRDGSPLESLPPGATIGTGSLRRRAQLLHARSDLIMCDVRGNVDTRLAKVTSGEFDAIVLAQSGLKRLGLEACISQVLEPPLCLPAVGQGALGIECRVDDEATRDALNWLEDAYTHQAVRAERTLLARLQGGCLAPIAAWARREAHETLRLDAAVLSPDGRRRLTAHGSAPLAEAYPLGVRVADELIAAGAAELIASVRL